MKDQDFEAFVRQYEKLVFTVCFQLVKDYGEAQNLAQDTFLSAYQHIDSYQGDNYKPWLIRIASNKAKDFLRSAYHRKVDATDDWEALPMKTEGSAEQETISRDSARIIEEIIRSLEEPYLKVSVLYFLEEKSLEEISRILERPPKTVETQLYRARKKLKTVLKERGIVI
ncbi:MAG: RNA polymerase sigma factor [Candidatus Merdivicinus sp.]|jgi:RNA polymerase sigma factor (sigma-70 family)